MEACRQTILLVDDETNILNSLRRLFTREGYEILTAPNGADGLETIGARDVDLVISDNRMPGMEGIEFLSRVKDLSPDTVRFMLTGYSDTDSVVAAINRGEVTKYITKPWDDTEIKTLVREAIEKRALVRENRRLLEMTRRQNAELLDLNNNLESKVEAKTRAIRENFFAMVRTFADLVELYDQFIGGHIKRVASLSRGLADHMGLEPAEADLVEAAGYLHAIGLIGVPKALIEKDPASLSGSERAVIAHNPVLTQSLLSSIGTLKQAGVIIRSHMERYDGGGYPDRLNGEEIHIGARILSVCKHYDHMTHARGESRPGEDALRHLEKMSGAWFDPEVVEAFKAYLGVREPETTVESVKIEDLTDGMVLAESLVSSRGRLLVSGGTRLTGELIEKILRFNRLDPITGGVKVCLTS